MGWADDELERARKEDPGWVKFFGVLTAIIMLIIVLGLLNRFSEWAFGAGLNI